MLGNVWKCLEICGNAWKCAVVHFHVHGNMVPVGNVNNFIGNAYEICTFPMYFLCISYVFPKIPDSYPQIQNIDMHFQTHGYLHVFPRTSKYLTCCISTAFPLYFSAIKMLFPLHFHCSSIYPRLFTYYFHCISTAFPTYFRMHPVPATRVRSSCAPCTQCETQLSMRPSVKF
jgi:hypothetical protein